MIELRDVVKTFRVKRAGHGLIGALFTSRFESVEVIHGVSLSVAPGETVGIVGPNGAGKTTLMRILAGVLQPSAGVVLIAGEPPRQQRHRIGLVVGSALLYHRITGYDNLELYGRLYGVKDIDRRIHDLAGFLGLEEWLDEFVEHYSAGLRSRLCLARALIHDPDVLILDEPTAGVDLFAANEIHRVLRQLGKTMVLATHDLDEVRLLSQRIVLLESGSVMRVTDAPGSSDLRSMLIDAACKNPRHLQKRDPAPPAL